MLAEIDALLARLYPTRTWGEPDDAGDRPFDDLPGLADELASVLNAATFVRHGDDDEPCDYIYALCLGRTPCIAQVRDHGVPPPAEWRSIDRLDEQYLRLVISQRAPVAALQQVAVQLVAAPGGYLIRESPRAGVYDAPLLHRMQKLVATLPAYGLLHIDFGEIAHAPPGFHGGSWPALYGAEPSIANYLFFPQPTTMIATMFVEDAGVRQHIGAA
jgi:hypothetical protein